MRHPHRLLSITIATLAALGTASGQNPVLNWNNTAITTALAASQATAPGSNTQPGSILYLAYVHLAIYDAVNAIDGRFQSYGPDISAPADASQEAAVTEAAYRTLAHLFPDQVSNLTTLYNAALAAIPDSIAKNNGMQAGLAAAKSILSLRSGDGRAELRFRTRGPRFPHPAFGFRRLPRSRLRHCRDLTKWFPLR